MDVRCPVCSTEYELDDARVPESGLPVKCSKCGHVFRASKKPAPSSAVASTGLGQISEWMIRRGTGETVRFRELTTLQRWIVERKVTRTDEISKTGKKWEKLGNIPELAIFFQVVESTPPQQVGPDTPPPPPVPTDVGRPSQPVLAAQAAAAEALPEAFTLEPSARTGPDPFSETMPDATGSFQRVEPPRPAPPPPAPVPAPVPAPAPSPFAPVTVDPPRSNVPVHIDDLEHRSATVPWQSGLSNLSDDVREEYELGSRPRDALLPRRFGAFQIVVMLLALIVAAAVVVYVARPTWVTGLFRSHVTGHSPEAMNDVNHGYAALRGDTAPAIDEAIQAFELAAKRDDAYELAYAGLAEALTARAELQRDLADFSAKALAANPGTDPAPETAKIAERRRTADADLQRASVAASKALELDAISVDANRAMLELARVRGDTTPLDTYAVRAQANAEDARVSLALGAWTMRDSAQRARATRYLETALQHEPQLAHARYLLAKIALDGGDKEKARAEADKVLEIAATHERALALKAMVEPEGAGTTEPSAPTAPTPPNGTTEPTVPTGPTPPTGPTGATAPTAPTGSTAPTATPTEPAGPKLPDDPTLTFGEALNRGEFLRNHDKPAQALRYYERAIKLRANDADAWLGMGWSKLDMHDPQGAIVAFQKAVNISPRFADANFGLAEAHKLRNNRAQAIRYYKQYLDIAPYGPQSDVARALIEKLEAEVAPPPPPTSPVANDTPPTEGTPAPPPPPPPPATP